MRRQGKQCIATVGYTWVALVAAAPCLGADRPMTDLVPADSLVVYMAKPYALAHGTGEQQGSGGASVGSSVATLLALLNATGLVPDQGQVYADIAAALPLLGRYEHALVLLDASSRRVRRPGKAPGDPPRVSLRLKHMQAAVVFRTKGEHQVVLKQLNRIVRRYTNKEVAALTTEKLVGHEFRRLADARMPGWGVWEWGRLGDFSVVCFGQGAYRRIAESYAGDAATLTQDAWFRSATAKTRGTSAIAQCFIGFDHVKNRMSEVASHRVEQVLDALGADRLTRDLWTLAFEGRALSWRRCYRRDGEDVVHHYSDPANQPHHHRRIVPDAARHFAIINAPTSWLVDDLPKAWLASQSPRNAQKWERIWKSLEEQTHIDFKENLVKHLKGSLVVFDYPPHPLDIPLAWTLAIEIDDHDAVKASLDALLAAWGQYLDERAERKDTTLVRIKVKKTKDDIWHLQAAGILGPALGVTNRYVVISWSPQALRDALGFVEPSLKPATPTAGSQPER
jgi:hypothetical protein